MSVLETELFNDNIAQIEHQDIMEEFASIKKVDSDKNKQADTLIRTTKKIMQDHEKNLDIWLHENDFDKIEWDQNSLNDNSKEAMIAIEKNIKETWKDIKDINTLYSLIAAAIEKVQTENISNIRSDLNKYWTLKNPKYIDPNLSWKWKLESIHSNILSLTDSHIANKEQKIDKYIQTLSNEEVIYAVSWITDFVWPFMKSYDRLKAVANGKNIFTFIKSIVPEKEKQDEIITNTITRLLERKKPKDVMDAINASPDKAEIIKLLQKEVVTESADLQDTINKIRSKQMQFSDIYEPTTQAILTCFNELVQYWFPVDEIVKTDKYLQGAITKSKSFDYSKLDQSLDIYSKPINCLAFYDSDAQWSFNKQYPGQVIKSWPAASEKAWYSYKICKDWDKTFTSVFIDDKDRDEIDYKVILDELAKNWCKDINTFMFRSHNYNARADRQGMMENKMITPKSLVVDGWCFNSWYLGQYVYEWGVNLTYAWAWWWAETYALFQRLWSSKGNFMQTIHSENRWWTTLNKNEQYADQTMVKPWDPYYTRIQEVVNATKIQAPARKVK